MTKIRRIERIENYRIFQNWKPSSGIEFARVNLIYGQNGSGKSTLASLFADCAANATVGTKSRGGGNNEADAGLQLLVANDAGESPSLIGMDDPEFWARVRVFNKDFVRRNLRFEEPDGPQPEALLTVGERLADAEEQLTKLRRELDDAQTEAKKAATDVGRVEKQMGSLLTRTAKSVTDSLLGTKVTEYNPRSYKKPRAEQVLNDFAHDPSIFDSASTELDVDRKIATSEAMTPVSLGTRGKVLAQDGVNHARELLGRDVVIQVIEELREHPERATWVQRGISLHEYLEDCLFCGQPLTAGRRTELSAHFDDSLKKLQTAIDSLVADFNNSVTASDDYLKAIPADASVYPDLKSALQQARAAYQREHAAYAETVATIIAALKEKRDNPFNSIAVDSELTLTVPEIAELQKIVADHREKVSKHDEEARQAARRVELHHVKEAAGDFVLYRRTREELERTRNVKTKRVDQLKGQIASLENVDGDPIPGAEDLTGYVGRLLGRDELTFNAAPDGQHYVITRSGVPASHLSEGEQTAIALLYFLLSVREDKIRGDKPIVIIDDPVSSLDSSILFGASAHLWTEFVVKAHTSQVFLMTHNFELFRQWLVQMERVPDKTRNKAGGYGVFEIKARYVGGKDGEIRRVPEMRPWNLKDRQTQKLRSQYHFLFSQVASALEAARDDLSLAEQMEITALMPNAARRMLESFLSFRQPDKMGSFHGSMSAALAEKRSMVQDEDRELDPAVRTYVERYLHTYSHFEEGDISRPLDPSESAAVLTSLFALMHYLDPEHLRLMCSTFGLDPKKLRELPNMSAGKKG
ncbi:MULTISPECIES: AAA family ATPase [unclassified Actinobaculum]|uniref:AAA family ATPase n=1 Tax=unclassified Actinobaculum TaxID=2609299 RepID=UPI0013DDB75A|nr:MULTISPECIES: AAA family ATPase [unclassified Actinobaculum]